MSAFQAVQCDGCGTVKGQGTVGQMAATPVRNLLKGQGWHTVRGTYQSVSGERGYTRDICPTCWHGGKR